MSDVIDSFGDPDQSRTSRTITTAAHLMPPVAFVVFTIAAVDDVSGGFLPDWMSWTVVAVWVGIYWVSAFHRTFARICVRCMQEVPADAGQQAERKRWLLWVDHHPGRMMLAFWAVIGAELLTRHVFAIPNGPSWLNLPSLLVLAPGVVAAWTHHRLRPWCPYCKPWDDGGQHESVPAPDPSGAKSS